MMIYFFGLVPVLYVLNQYIGVNLNGFGVKVIVLLILGGDVFWWWKIRRRVKWDKALISVIILFSLMHILFYRFYGTMPETDGYIDLLRIERMAKSGIIDYDYRQFFYTAITMLTIVTKINPYYLFTSGMIAMSASVILVLSKISEVLKISGWRKLLLLLSALSFPVLNLEIDFFRPQNMYIIFFPIWFYLVYRKRYILAGLMALVGLGYHQFFIFPLLASVGILAWKHLPKRSVYVGILAILSFGIWKYWGKFTWHWWFLDNYSTYPDNVQMGWPGINGAAMFYGYYYGPMFLTVIILLFKKAKDMFVWTMIFMLIGFLSISELLPRILFAYLPERFAILSDLVVLMMLPVAVARIKFKNIHIWLWLVLILIGIGASVYIAKNKGSLTTLNEKNAAEWLKNNTPTEAIIATQESNQTMMLYYARRNWIPIKDVDKSDYILFSKDKLFGLYSKRLYWCGRNNCDLNINEFGKKYKLIYDINGVYIWKTKN
jgi:hypothetical protein